MQSWTVVIEILDGHVNDPDLELDYQTLKNAICAALSSHFSNFRKISFQIMECIKAPYGPQKHGGVFICESSRHGNFRE